MPKNMFAKAESLNKQEAPKKKAKKEKVEYEIKNLKTVAEISALIDDLGKRKAELEKDIKSDAFDIFYDESIASGSKIDNFIGVDDSAFASVEMKRRSPTSVLSCEEIELLKAAGIKTEKIVTIPELYAINPKYSQDKKLLKEVNKALKGVVPEDFIAVQEEISKEVVSEKSLDQAFQKKASKEVVEILTTMAIKPKLKEVKLKDIWSSMKNLLFPKGGK